MKQFLLGIFLIALVSAGLYFGQDYLPKIKTKVDNDMGYSETSKKRIEELELEIDTYSETLDKALETKNYVNSNLDNYMEIDYIDNEHFNEAINLLLENNYTANEINGLSFIFENEHYKNEYLERYINYYEKNKDKKDNIVIYVNIGLDRDFYTNINEIKDPNDILVLVNKYNKLPDSYASNDLFTFDKKYLAYDRKTQLRKVAADALIEMIKAINKEGMSLWLISGYRTKSYQNMLFTNSVKKNGMNHALIYSAKQRHSEHETGLAADISSVKGMLNGFEKYKEYTWLKNNAHKYGFIERYPKDKEFITGYAYESWHWRYVGVEVATIIKNENITFEEYAVKYMNY